MKRNELTKTFIMMISNQKQPFGLHGLSFGFYYYEMLFRCH